MKLITGGLRRHWTTGFRFPAEAGNFSRYRVQTGSSSTHPASYPTGTGGLRPCTSI